MEAAHGRDDTAAFGRDTRELERPLDRLGPAVAEENAIE